MHGEQRLVKVALKSPDGEVETLWAADLGGGRYRLDNTPWYANGVSWQDVVEARPDADGQLHFERVSEKSGNRTIRIVADEPFSDEWLEQIVKRGCSFEGANRKYIGINIPPEVDLATIASFLTDAGVRWEHADPTHEQYHAAQAPNIVLERTREK
jgi:hypothetical protein